MAKKKKRTPRCSVCRAPLTKPMREAGQCACGVRFKPIKPKASRDKSSETFLVGIGLKNPNLPADKLP